MKPTEEISPLSASSETRLPAEHASSPVVEQELSTTEQRETGTMYNAPEKPDTNEHAHTMRRPHSLSPATRSTPSPDPFIARIEKIMEEGIGESYERLSPIAQQEFKLKGEDTAREIRLLLGDTHLKIKKVFRLILQWLKLLPGINRFFLEQEAKIKTDRIILLHRDQRHLVSRD